MTVDKDGDRMGMYELRDAVIEAARKLNRIWPTADFGSAEWLCARDDFHEAVEALEREGE